LLRADLIQEGLQNIGCDLELAALVSGARTEKLKERSLFSIEVVTGAAARLTHIR
jgi:hypothetical protein